MIAVWPGSGRLTFSDDVKSFYTLVCAYNGNMGVVAETVDRARAEAVEYVESITSKGEP